MNEALTLPGIGDLVDGRFRIDRKLGEGGTSTVYEVSHVITDKKFAIKWLLPELALEDAAVDRFIHEARVGGKFAHPHAVQVYDICKASDSFYMLMELLEGECLQTRLEREGKLTLHEAASIILSCAEVLSAAHRIGIIHRDLKPANIFLCSDGEGPEVTKLLDFGISTFCSDLQSLSLTATPRGSVIGTPLYMSPEQMLGAEVDPRTDIYALGAVLYELVSGVPPFQADNYGELVVKVTVEARPTPLVEIASVDKQFAAVVARAMARRAADRFSTVEELIFALRPYAAAADTSTVRAIGGAVASASNLHGAGIARSTGGSAHNPRSLVQAQREASDVRLVARRESKYEALEPLPSRSKSSAGLALLTCGLTLAVVTLVSIGGARWFDPAGHLVTGSAPGSAQAADQPLVAAPKTALPSGDSNWGTPTSSELLTGRAAPDGLPSPTAGLHPAAKSSANPGHLGATTTTRRDKDRGDKADKGDKPRIKSTPHKRTPNDSADDGSAVSTQAPQSSGAKTLPGADLQLQRGDFRAPPENTAPPKASVSRDDF